MDFDSQSTEEIISTAVHQLAMKAREQTRQVISLSTAIGDDLHQLSSSKKANVTQYESAKRELRGTMELFQQYLREIDSLFKYLQENRLTCQIVSELNENTTTSLEVLLQQLKKSIDRAKVTYTNFQDKCKNTEKLCQSGASECQKHTIKAERQKINRRNTGGTLAINQILLGIGGVSFIIVLIILIVGGTISFNTASATGLAVALVVSVITITIAVVAIVIIFKYTKKYQHTGRLFCDIEDKFKDIDRNIMDFRHLLSSQLHSHVLDIERIMNDSMDILNMSKSKDDSPNPSLKEKKDESKDEDSQNPSLEEKPKEKDESRDEMTPNFAILVVNVNILLAKSTGYHRSSRELHKQLNSFFSSI